MSGPFHTRYMEKAGDALEREFAKLEFGDMTFPILFNCVGREKTSNEEIAELLVRQVSTGVLMEDIIKNIIKTGVESIVEIGPGKVLSGFVRKIDRDVNCISISNVSDFEAAVKALKG